MIEISMTQMCHLPKVMMIKKIAAIEAYANSVNLYTLQQQIIIGGV